MDQVAFARFVRRAMDDVKTRRGWTVSRLAAETGVGRSTLFRWLNGDCQEFPELENVRSFCAALDIPVSAAFTALGVRHAGSEPDAEAAAEPDTESRARADVQTIMRRLTDPSVSAEEKTVIRNMLSYLANGTAARAG